MFRIIRRLFLFYHLHVKPAILDQPPCPPPPGSSLIPMLLNEYLFPASKLASEPLPDSPNPSSPARTHSAKCTGQSSRLAAYELLVLLARGCQENLDILVEFLVSRELMGDFTNLWFPIFGNI